MKLEQGVALLRGGRFQEALQVFAHVLRQDAESVQARMGLAQAALGSGEADAAIAWFSDACRVAPLDPAPAHALGEQLLNRGLYRQALAVYARLYGPLQARDRATVLHHAFSLEQTGAIDEAIPLYREALELHPDFMEAHVNLAGVLWRVGDYDGAEAHARSAVALAPDHPYAVRILGTALLHQSRPAEAEAVLRRALLLQPGFALASIDLALAQLLAGNMDEGWASYHQRWADTQRMVRPAFFRPDREWQGPQRQPLRGQRVLVYAEQGLGDVIQFIRYVPLLQADGATVFAVVQPELVPLLESLPGLVCHKAGVDISADVHVALLDLPFHYRTSLGPPVHNLPVATPYLRASEPKLVHWRERLKPWDGQLKVGLAWAGHAVQVNHRNRSMPLSALVPLLGMDGVQCFSLQKSDGGMFTDCVTEPDRLVDFTPDWQDFADSAAMVEALDLVITIDSAVTHLAGALGKPVWLMLPPNPDWRWLLARDDSPWYPSMRLFRRGYGEGCGEVVARVQAALQAPIQAHMQKRAGL